MKAAVTVSGATVALLVSLMMTGAGPCSPELLAAEQSGEVVRFEAIGLTIHPLVEGVWRHVTTAILDGGRPIPANGLIVTSDSEAILIDTGWNATQTAALLDWIENDLRRKPIGVVATHFHADCMGGLEVALDRGLKTWGWSGTTSLAESEKLKGPETTFEDRLTVEVGDLGIELFYPGAGHATDNIVAWVPERRLLFGGCLIKSAEADHIGYTGNADLASWPRAVDAVRARYPEVRVIVPGHGVPGSAELYDNTLRIIQETRQ